MCCVAMVTIECLPDANLQKKPVFPVAQRLSFEMLPKEPR